MMYNINDIENIFDLVAYTVSAMKEVGYNDGEINDYLESTIKSKNNFNTVLLSKDRLNDCNLLSNKINPNYNWFDDTWRDSYYSSLWDDDGRYDEDVNDYLASKNSNNIWDDDNVIDDIETDDEKEAYEGFSSCKNHYWDSSEEDDDEDDSNWRIKDYYESMRKEFDPSYDLCYDPRSDEDDFIDD